MKPGATPSVVPKFSELGGSKGRAAWMGPQFALRPFSPTPQMLKNVHRAGLGALEMLEVSAWRK